MNKSKLVLACVFALSSVQAYAIDLQDFQQQVRAVVPDKPFKSSPVCMLEGEDDEAENVGQADAPQAVMRDLKKMQADVASQAEQGQGASCSFFNNHGMLDASLHLHIGISKADRAGIAHPVGARGTAVEIEGWKGTLMSRQEPEDGFVGNALTLTHPQGKYQLTLAAGWRPGAKDALSADSLKAMASKLARVYANQPDALSSAGTKETLSGTVGSCVLKNGWCQEFADVQGLNLAAVMQSVGEGCNAGGGKWSDKACSHAGMGGACRSQESITHGTYRMSVWYPAKFELLPQMKQGCKDWIAP